MASRVDPLPRVRAGTDSEAGLPWILGHRGAPREAPENTLASLGRALDLGLDGVEYDLQRCASAEAVLMHDETLDRTTDLHGPVEDATLPEISGADAGSWFHRDFAGEPVPLLQEALALAGPETRFGSRAKSRTFSSNSSAGTTSTRP